MSTTTTENVLCVHVQADEPAVVSARLSAMVERIGVIAATLVACVAMLETGLRLIGRYQLTGLDGYFAQEGISYGLKRNATSRVFWPTTSFLVHTDDLGGRAGRPGPRELTAKPYYAVLGSSDAFGNGLDYEKTFVGVFARKMAAHHETEVVNLAVGGHHLLEQIARFKDFAARAPAAPGAVIITLNPLLIGGFDDTNTNVVVRRGELFHRDGWRLALAKMMLSRSSAAYSFFRDGIRNVQLRYFSRADFSLDFYLSRYSRTARIRTPEATAAFERHMVDLEQFIRTLGATPIYVYSPATGGFLLDRLQREGRLDGSTFDTQFFRDLTRRHCAASGIRFIDLEPILQERYDRGEKLNFDLDAHFNEPTSLAIGEYLYQMLKP